MFISVSRKLKNMGSLSSSDICESVVQCDLLALTLDANNIWGFQWSFCAPIYLIFAIACCLLSE